MKNKKNIIIVIAILVVIGITAIIAALYLSKVLSKKETFIIDDYKITVNAKKVESQNSDSYFTTEFETESDYIYKYLVEFQGIGESKSEKGIIYELRDHDITINVNGKLLYCYFDLDEAPSNMTIYYYIENTKNYVIINVKGIGVYTKEGNQLKMMPNIKNDKKLQNSEDLKRILDIKVEKN